MSWDDSTKTATVTYDGNTLSVKSNSSNNRNGTIYVDDSLFVSTFGVGDDKLVVYQEGNNVSIRANFNISGDASTKTVGNSTDTYADVFLQGIESTWSGTFGKYNVSTYTGQSSSGINVTIKDESGVSGVRKWWFWSKNTTGNVTMFTGDSRNTNSYSSTDFMWVSAHEFGHILGVGDAYNSKNNTNVVSIYNTFGTGVQEVDIDMVLKAWNTDKFQRWN